YQQYQRRLIAISQDADAKIAANDAAAEERKKQILDQAAEDQATALQAIVLASVDEWHRANATILLDSQKRISEIDKAERTALMQWDADTEQYVAIEAAAQAKREAVWAETNQKIAEEHKRQVEQLGNDLESLFNDIGSGNLGTRILNNMKKLFAQIVA